MSKGRQGLQDIIISNQHNPPSSKREIWSWAFYDFANSPFSTTITSVVFNVYFARVVVTNSSFYGDTLWAMLVAAATLTSGVISPILGAIADLRNWKKPFLLASVLIGAPSTGLLIFSGPGTIVFSSACFLVASLCFSASLVFYNAFLNDLSTTKNIGSVSGLGWALGYIGGGLCLAVNLVMIQKPELLGLNPQDHWPERLSFLSVGIWWLLFSLPVLLFVRERKKTTTQTHHNIFRYAVHNVTDSLRLARFHHRNLFRCLISYLLYNDGIETVIVMASLFASQILFMGQGEIIACFLLIQFVAFFGALFFGRLGDILGNKKALQISLVVWSGIIFWSLLMKTKVEFWIAGGLIGLVLGGSQSLSRSLFGKLLPKGSEAQFYGFLNLSGKISATLGPLTYGIFRQITGSPRAGILSMLIFFVLGQILLFRVQEPSDE